MLYRIEVYKGNKPIKIGNWAWTNKGQAVNAARHYFENWVTGDRDKLVLVRQQKYRKVVFRRLPTLK